MAELSPPPLSLQGKGVGRMRDELLDFSTERGKENNSYWTPVVLVVPQFSHL